MGRRIDFAAQQELRPPEGWDPAHFRGAVQELSDP